MLETLLVWMLCLTTTLPMGKAIGSRIGKFLGLQTQFSIWVNFWVGLAGMSAVLNLLSFGLRLHPINKFLVWTFFLWVAIANRNWMANQFQSIKIRLRSFHLAALLFGLFTTLLAILKTTGLPEIFDEGAYHLPLIRMWEGQGLVPGMANLNGHYGLNSTWHLLSAFTNLNFLPFWNTSMVLNGLVASFLGWFAADRLQRILDSSGRVSDWIVIFLPIFIFRNLLSSPSTDIPAIICSWFIFTLWLENIEKEESPWEIWPVLVILPIWTILLKASSAPLLLIPLGMILLSRKQKNFRNLFVLLAIGLLMLFPWMLQNWFLSGYAIFPVRLTAIGNPEWQVPISSIDKKFYLEQFGAFAPPERYNWEWFSTWFRAHNGDTKVILILSLSAMVSVLIALIRHSAQRVWAKVYLYATVLVCLITWLLTITEPRYGFGALVFSALFPLAIVLRKTARFRPELKLNYIAVGVVVVFSSNVWKTVLEFKGNKNTILAPSERPRVAFRNLMCGNFVATTPVVYLSEVPEGKPVFCWDCPFPCVPKEGIDDSTQIEKMSFGPYEGFRFAKGKPQRDQ
jgi:hypothetical protein